MLEMSSSVMRKIVFQPVSHVIPKCFLTLNSRKNGQNPGNLWVLLSPLQFISVFGWNGILKKFFITSFHYVSYAARNVKIDPFIRKILEREFWICYKIENLLKSFCICMISMFHALCIILKLFWKRLWSYRQKARGKLKIASRAFRSSVAVSNDQGLSSLDLFDP